MRTTITTGADGFLVQSFTLKAVYQVSRDASACDCPHHTNRKVVCKHMALVQQVIAAADGVVPDGLTIYIVDGHVHTQETK